MDAEWAGSIGRLSIVVWLSQKQRSSLVYLGGSPPPQAILKSAALGVSDADLVDRQTKGNQGHGCRLALMRGHSIAAA